MVGKTFRDSREEGTDGDVTRRGLLATGSGVGAISSGGCIDGGVPAVDSPSVNDTTPSTGSTMPAEDILVCTDGTTVYAIDGRKRISAESVTDRSSLIHQSDDTGEVLQALFDRLDVREESGPIESGGSIPSRHIRFARGSFPWYSGVETGGTNAVRITGNYNATSWRAEDSFETFIDFQEPPSFVGSRMGPIIGNLRIYANYETKHVFTLSPFTDWTYMHDLHGKATKVSMIYAQASSETDNMEFFDHATFHRIGSSFGGALAILEDGNAGIPAGCHFRDCSCYVPDDFGLIFRNPQRMVVDRFTVGIGGQRRRSEGGEDYGGVLIENPPMNFDRGDPNAQQCYLRMVELEDPSQTREGAAVHIRSPEDATNRIENIKVVFPRGSHSGRFLKAESAIPYRIRDVELDGSQINFTRPDAVELINTADCRINMWNGSRNTRRGVRIENGKRNLVNGIGRSAGDPWTVPEWEQGADEGTLVWDSENQSLHLSLESQWATVLDSVTLNGSEPNSPDEFGLSFLVNDNDGEGRKGWVEWAGGIGRGKDPSQFKRVSIVDDPVDASAGTYPVQRETVSIDGSYSSAGGVRTIRLPADATVVDIDGVPTVEGFAWFAIDDQNLYFSAKIEDESFVTDGDLRRWKVDSVQLGVTADVPEQALSYHIFTASQTPDGPVLQQTHPSVSDVPGSDIAITRDGETTVYQVAIPRDHLGL